MSLFKNNNEISTGVTRIRELIDTERKRRFEDYEKDPEKLCRSVYWDFLSMMYLQLYYISKEAIKNDGEEAIIYLQERSRGMDIKDLMQGHYNKERSGTDLRDIAIACAYLDCCAYLAGIHDKELAEELSRIF